MNGDGCSNANATMRSIQQHQQKNRRENEEEDKKEDTLTQLASNCTSSPSDPNLLPNSCTAGGGG